MVNSLHITASLIFGFDSTGTTGRLRSGAVGGPLPRPPLPPLDGGGGPTPPLPPLPAGGGPDSGAPVVGSPDFSGTSLTTA